MSVAILFVAHGSREDRSNEDFLRSVADFSKKYGHKTVLGSFLELAAPSIPEGIEACVRSGAQDVFVLPLMLFWGRHVAQDIPRFLDEARRRHPEVHFHYAGPLADSPEFARFLEAHVESLGKRDKEGP